MTASERKALEPYFRDLLFAWPSRRVDSYGEGLNAWLELTGDERFAARDMAATYNATRPHCAISKYLKLKKWLGLEKMVAQVGKVRLSVFGKAWMVVRLAVLRAGPGPATGRFITNEARWRAQYPFVASLDSGLVMLEVERMPQQEILDAMCRVKVGSAEWQAWQEYHAYHDWPFINSPDYVEWLWFPTVRPVDWEHCDQESAGGTEGPLQANGEGEVE